MTSCTLGTGSRIILPLNLESDSLPSPPASTAQPAQFNLLNANNRMTSLAGPDWSSMESAVPQISPDLETVHKELEQIGIPQEQLETHKKSLSVIQKFLQKTEFSNNLTANIEQSEILKLTNIDTLRSILSQQSWQSKYKPLIKLLFEQELSKYSDPVDLGLIMHTLIKINAICDITQETLNNALKKIITDKNLSKSEDANGDVATNCQIITTHLQENTNHSLDVMGLLYQDEELDLKDPFKSTDVDDDSSEERGWFESMKYAFFHPIEFVQEKWGKKKDRSTDEINEKDRETADQGSHDHSTSYFKDAIKWIFTLGGLFSSTNEANENNSVVQKEFDNPGNTPTTPATGAAKNETVELLGDNESDGSSEDF